MASGLVCRSGVPGLVNYVSTVLANSAKRRAVGCVTWPAAASHIQAAVDPPHLAGDVSGGVGGEEVDDARDLLRLGETAHRDLGLDPLKQFLRHRLAHLRGDVARRGRVDREADAVVAELSRARQLELRLAGEGLRQAEEARLRRRVVRLPDVASLSAHGGDA